MKPHAFVLGLIVTLSIAQTPGSTSPAPQKPCTPGVSFWYLLDQVRIGYVDGRLELGRLYALCLPTPHKQSSSSFPYDPDGGSKLSTLVKTADGEVLTTYVWYAKDIGEFWELSRFRVLSGPGSVKPLNAGNYELEFAIEDKPFYRFPFSVVVMPSDNPAAAGNRYFLEGAWNEYGDLYYHRNDPQSTLTFTIWIQDKVGHELKNSAPYAVKLISARDGRVLGMNEGNLPLNPRWSVADLYFRPAGGDANAAVSAGDMLREDGRYSIQLTINNTLYGTYPLEVRGGRIELQGKQIREKTDPMVYIFDYLTGGYTTWWLKREG